MMNIMIYDEYNDFALKSKASRYMCYSNECSGPFIEANFKGSSRQSFVKRPK